MEDCDSTTSRARACIKRVTVCASSKDRKAGVRAGEKGRGMSKQRAAKVVVKNRPSAYAVQVVVVN